MQFTLRLNKVTHDFSIRRRRTKKKSKREVKRTLCPIFTFFFFLRVESPTRYSLRVSHNRIFRLFEGLFPSVTTTSPHTAPPPIKGRHSDALQNRFIEVTAEELGLVYTEILLETKPFRMNLRFSFVFWSLSYNSNSTVDDGLKTDEEKLHLRCHSLNFGSDPVSPFSNLGLK